MANQKRSKSQNWGAVNPPVGTQTQRVSTPWQATLHSSAYLSGYTYTAEHGLLFVSIKGHLMSGKENKKVGEDSHLRDLALSLTPTTHCYVLNKIDDNFTFIST